MEFGKIATLLDIIHKAASAGPAYAYWGDMAHAELFRLKAEAEPPPPPPKPKLVVPTRTFPSGDDA